MDTTISLEREYELKKLSIQEEKDKLLKEAYEKYPRLKEITDEIKTLGIQGLKLSISHDEKSKEEFSKLQDKIKRLEEEKNGLINRERIILEPEYNCKICKDTGYIIKDNLITSCTCLKQKKINQYYNKFNSIRLNDETFDNFDVTLYSDRSNPQKYSTSLSPRDNIKRIVERSRKFIDGDEEFQNLLFIGSTGIGKTFLSRMYSK